MATTAECLDNINFKLNRDQVMKLIPSIKALSDSKFNPEGVAMMDITEKGFELTVRNHDTDVVGHLLLNASELNYFHCKKSIVSKMINLKPISVFLMNNDTLDDESLTVDHLHELSTTISFCIGGTFAKLLGGTFPKLLAVEFLEDNAEFEKFPAIVEFSCEAVFEFNVMSRLIDHLRKHEGTQLVVASISEDNAFINTQGKTPLSYAINKDEAGFETKVLTPGKIYDAYFEFHYIMSMVEALTAAALCRFHLRFLTEPSDNIMIKFELRELGELVFIQKAILITSDIGVALRVAEASSTEELVNIITNLKKLKQILANLSTTL